MTVKAGNLAGTEGTLPQVPPKLCGAGSKIELCRWRALRSGWSDDDVDVDVGGDVGGSLKVTCRSHSRGGGGGAQTG